jgi:hypothetical protein
MVAVSVAVIVFVTPAVFGVLLHPGVGLAKMCSGGLRRMPMQLRLGGVVAVIVAVVFVARTPRFSGFRPLFMMFVCH